METGKFMRKFNLCLMAIFTLVSATAQDKHSTFHLSFVPPLSTNGIKAYEYTNGTSFNLLAGISRNEENFSFAGLSNVITNDAKGFQFAGLSNFIGNNGRGMLFSGIANITKGSYNGFQFAGLGNIVKDDVAGFQFAGLINTAKKVSGFQFAGVINIAENVSGFQFAGVMNKAKNVNGVQFAGLINIAENSDYPIGLVNIIKNGEKSIAVTYNEVGSILATFRSGGKVTYGIIGVGYNHKTSGRSYATEAGFGIHINCLPWFRINNELKVACFGASDNLFIINDDRLNTVIHTNYSILPAFKISPHIELFGGPSLNYMNSGNANKDLEFGHSIWEKTGTTRLQQIYIGYQVGIQYIF